MMGIPDLAEAGGEYDYSGLSPDVIKTIIGEGDPAHVASVLYNRKTKSGLSYDTLINDPKQFSAHENEAWAKNKELKEDDPAYQNALSIAGPILLGYQPPVTSADSFYSPKAMRDNAKASFDDGTGKLGPDGQLYFEGKYSPPSIPDLAEAGGPEEPATDTPEALARDSATDNASNDINAKWPVYDPYNNVGRNQDGSIAYVQHGTDEDYKKQRADDRQLDVLHPDEGMHISVGYGRTDNPNDISYWLKTHPDDIANKVRKDQPLPETKGGIATGLEQGLANVKNSIEGLGVNLPGWRNDLTTNLMNRARNDAANDQDMGYHFGKFGGELLATAPIMAIPGLDALTAGSKIAPAMKFLSGTYGSGLTRGLSLGTSGALQGTEASALTSAGSSDPLSQQLATGALTGAVASPILHGLGTTAVNHFFPKVSAPVSDLADKAVNKFGIDLQVPQILGGDANTGAQAVHAKLAGNSGSDYASKVAAQGDQFTRAVSRTLGADSDTLTKDVLTKAQSDVGNEINGIAARNKITKTSDLLSTIRGILQEAKDNGLNADQMKRLTALGKNISKTIKNGEIPGASYKTLISYGSPLDSAAKDESASISRFAQEIRGALDDSFDAEAGVDAPAMKAARTKYKTLMAVAPIVDPRGKVPTGGLLDAAVSHAFQSEPLRGAGDIGHLADIDTLFLHQTPPPPKSSMIRDIGLAGVGGAIGGQGLQGMFSDPLLGIKLAAASAGLTAIKHVVGTPAQEFLENKMVSRARILRGDQTDVPAGLKYLGNQFAVPTVVLGGKTLAPKSPIPIPPRSQ